MKRISLDEVQAAYACTELVPTINDFYRERRGVHYACPLTALIALRHRFEGIEYIREVTRMGGTGIYVELPDYPHAYLYGFWRSVDNPDAISQVPVHYQGTRAQDEWEQACRDAIPVRNWVQRQRVAEWRELYTYGEVEDTRSIEQRYGALAVR